MKRKLSAILLAAALALSVTACDGLGVQYGEEERSDTTYLYINTYDGGYRTEYLETVARVVEEEYKEKSYADGKKGLVVKVEAAIGNSGSSLKANMANSTFNIHVVEALHPMQYVTDGLLADITDIVKGEVAAGEGMVEDKLFDDQKTALGKDGKYYALPTFAGFTGLSYNAKLFADRNYYFADAAYVPESVSSYTGKTYTGRGFVSSAADKRSPGPDGVYNTEDDGLPSSYEEFFYLLDQMSDDTVTPIIWSGANMHYTNYLFQALLSAACTRTELATNFTFDSGNETVDVVRSIAADGTPATEAVKITNDNGYEMSQQVQRYQALKFLEKLFTEKKGADPKYFSTRSEGGGLSNQQAQRVFLEGNFTGEKIAMLIDGNYWYNEAENTRKSLIGTYSDEAENMNVRYMTLPWKETGTVDENEGKPLTIGDTMYYYMVVNNNISGNAEKMEAAKDFIRTFYRASSLQAATVASGIPMAVKYDLPQAQYDRMDNYAQSLWNVYKTAKDGNRYVTTESSNATFQAGSDRFAYRTTGKFFNTTVNGVERSIPYAAFTQNGVTAKSYFEGMKITENSWNQSYKK